MLKKRNTLKTLFILIAILFTSPSFGQSLWFQEDATWVHRVIQLNAGGFIETTVEKDTIINGINCKKLKGYYELYDINPPFPLVGNGKITPQFMYATSDDSEVYYYENGSFKKIYDFNANVGDLVELPYNPVSGLASICPNNKFIIDSIGTEEIGGIQLKWISVSQTSESQHFYSGKIYQKIGSINWYFNSLVSPGICLGTVEDMNFVDEFRCFSDVNIEYKNQGVIDSWGGNCYFPGMPPITNTVESIEQREISIYPNPVHTNLTIDLKEINFIDIEDIEIIDIRGSIIQVTKSDQFSNTIDVSSLSSGIYFLKLSNYSLPIKFIKL